MNDSTTSKGSRAAADVAGLLRARNPLIWITTREEVRAERLLMEAAQVAQYAPRFWDCATGVTDYAGKAIDKYGGAGTTDPAAALAQVRDSKEREVWIMRDLPAWLQDPMLRRTLRTLARELPLANRNEARALIVLSPGGEIPDDLAGNVQAVEWPLPDRGEIAALLDASISGLPEEMRAQAATNGTRDAAIDAAVGLTATEAEACFAKSLVTHRRVDPVTIAQEKKRIIERERVLEWFDPLPEGLDAIGGLDALKDWLNERRLAFSAKARAYGLPAPKGVLLVGIPGGGKSLTAKAVATAYQMPLLKLDMGALKSKFVGESEANVRKALNVAETLGRCVLWLDEIEKALAGATQGAADGGVSADALGSILSWMQDRAGSVFVIATANDVSALPPELLRKGRFDEIFFVDLPTERERAHILAAALRQNKRELPAEDLAQVAHATPDFTGAELAALVPAAMFTAFADAEREITSADLVSAAHQTVPLARTAAEKIEALRKWAKGRARSASHAAIVDERQSSTRTLDL